MRAGPSLEGKAINKAGRTVATLCGLGSGRLWTWLAIDMFYFVVLDFLANYCSKT